jgi:hypothetical protein
VKWVSGYPVPMMLPRVKQYPPVHQEGWMISGQETVYCWVPVAGLTRVVGLDDSTTCLRVVSR